MPMNNVCVRIFVCVSVYIAYYVCTSIDHSVTEIIRTVFHMVELLMW